MAYTQMVVSPSNGFSGLAPDCLRNHSTCCSTTPCCSGANTLNGMPVRRTPHTKLLFSSRGISPQLRGNETETSTFGLSEAAVLPCVLAGGHIEARFAGTSIGNHAWNSEHPQLAETRRQLWS